MLLFAVCAVVDFTHLADDLTGGRAGQDITAGCDPRYRAAIAACVLATPYPDVVLPLPRAASGRVREGRGI
jgi:hypothetical protein